MRIYWYWPFARAEELPLACATARPRDEITVHVIDRLGPPFDAPCDRVRLCEDLPDVRRDRARSPAWLFSRAGTYARRARQRERLIASFRPDVCHVHYLNRFTDWLLPLKARRALVISVHDVLPHEGRLPRHAEQALLAATYRRADALIVHHEVLRRRLLEVFAVDERRIHVVPHQVFAYLDADPIPLPSHPCVLFLGSLRNNKGIDTLLSAIASTTADTTFVIAGRGEPRLEAALQQAARSDRRIHVEIGHVTQHRKIELFQQASVVVLPYTSFASQSGVLHDAYAHGRPVIVSDVGALGETVREDDTGRVVPPSDVASLSRAIGETVANTGVLHHHAQMALAVREARSPRRVGPLLRKVYDTVLA